MKKFLSILFVFAIIFSFSACGADGKDGKDENPQGLDFYLKDDGTYAVGVGTAGYLSKIVIPETYCGKVVNEIVDFAFADRITSYSIKVEEIIIPSSVTVIGIHAFAYNCDNLTSINFEGTVEQWNAIELGNGWNYGVPATEVICSNGTVPLN